MWKLLVKNQSIEIMEREVLADNQIQYVQMKFTFDGDWKKFHKVVQFSQCDETYSIVLGFDGTSCYLPAELHAGAAKMSVFGYDAESDSTVRATTVPITLNIRPSGFVGDDDTPIPPTPDLYTQLIKKIEDTTKGDPGKSAYELAVEEGFDGTEEEWLASLHGADGTDGVNGKSAYEIAVENGYSGTEEEWLESLHGKDGISPDMSDYPTTADVTTIIERVIEPVAEESHTHDNMDILNGTTASYTAEEQAKLAGINADSYATKDELNAEALSIREAMIPLTRELHSHQNKAVLDAITSDDLTAVQSLPAFKQETAESIQAVSEAVDTVAAETHHHDNKAVLDSITAIDTHLDESSTNPVANYVLALAIDVLRVASHTHGNAGTLEKITEQMVSNMTDYGQFEDWVREQIHTLFESVNNYSNTAHTHENKAILDAITSDLLTLLQNLQQYEDSTTYEIQTVKESVEPVVSQAHWHHNLTILNSITQAKITEWDSVSTLKTQMNSLSTTLSVYNSKCENNTKRIGVNEADIDSIQETLEALQAQIDNLSGSILTLFQNGSGTLEKYGETIYTFYNDGYRSLSGFVQSYPNFCNAENNYALYYNQTDFSWAGVVYTMCLTPFHLTANSGIIFSYLSGATDTGEMYLVPKDASKSGAELARYIYESIEGGTAITLTLQWLYSTAFISILTDCEGVTSGDYYLAWRAVSDNTHPQIKAIKVLGA